MAESVSWSWQGCEDGSEAPLTESWPGHVPCPALVSLATGWQGGGLLLCCSWAVREADSETVFGMQGFLGVFLFFFFIILMWTI